MSSSSGRRYRLPPQAIEDLIQIYNHLYERSPLAAERFTSDSERKIIDLAGSKNPGVCRERLKPGLRAFPYRRRCIYFRAVEDALVVLRITHGRQGITPDTFPESED
ncbi:type II toxin-antitoxin system RelE/ParE family toxin [Rhizobium sp. 'Codium 1']|uniref:type II toxin-antitoxin system RelE/ParE family toxin n=1 Tax=Rhizobium sp. 'Codium 1' TaxID=2940484 RepID=UPI001E5F0F0F|nr:type II toxin-antitoxin system RelE/ParE family toxin [Rhizobium sp. 'Codium 1']MCC8933712.1 type II toxin-antitoxin system RelE/ParE family toxin [Rhizobium sp. 'Codium 1']